jgi:hypothetical protein
MRANEEIAIDHEVFSEVRKNGKLGSFSSIQDGLLSLRASLG